MNEKLVKLKVGDIVGKIIAITNQKGGVGKTTTSVNLGACLAYIGKRVLLVDIDPQGNATSGIGIEKADVEKCVYDILVDDADVLDVIKTTEVENLDVIPATIQLAGAEIELVPTISREVRLKRALESVKQNYDYMIIDCIGQSAGTGFGCSRFRPCTVSETQEYNS